MTKTGLLAEYRNRATPILLWCVFLALLLTAAPQDALALGAAGKTSETPPLEFGQGLLWKVAGPFPRFFGESETPTRMLHVKPG